MATVQINRLGKSYAGTRVLADLELEADEHEFVTLLGPSGCGKTTTLRCLAGLERAEAGEIRIGGTLVAAPASKVFVPPNRRGTGMVFQSYALWPHMTVFANVAYPLRVRRTDRSETRRRVMEMLEAVGMDAYAVRQVTDLSGGQQQRVALARAMVGRPGLLLFDEPLSNLDAKLRRSMRREIRAAHDRSGATSVYVTHDQEEAIALSDRVVVMRAGVVQQTGSPRDIYRRPANRFVAHFVGFDNLLPGRVTATRDNEVAVAVAGSATPVWAAMGQSLRVGQLVELAARAEHVRLVAAAGGDAPIGTSEGRVLTRSYTGDAVEYTLEMAGGPIVARVPEDAAVLSADQLAWVGFDSERCVAVSAEETVLETEPEERASVSKKVEAPA